VVGALMDLPEYVRYDFLATVIGLALASVAFYYLYLQTAVKVSENILNGLFILSMPFIVYGLGEMYTNYRVETEVFFLESIIKRKKSIDEMKQAKLLHEGESGALHYFLQEELTAHIDKRNKEREK
jgi:hypothetical protein